MNAPGLAGFTRGLRAGRDGAGRGRCRLCRVSNRGDTRGGGAGFCRSGSARSSGLGAGARQEAEGEHRRESGRPGRSPSADWPEERRSPWRRSLGAMQFQLARRLVPTQPRQLGRNLARQAEFGRDLLAVVERPRPSRGAARSRRSRPRRSSPARAASRSTRAWPVRAGPGPRASRAACRAGRSARRAAVRSRRRCARAPRPVLPRPR